MSWVYAAAALFCLSPWASPPLALLLGCAAALLLGNPYASRTKNAATFLLQASVVGLGFGLDFSQVLKVGSQGLAYTAGGICLTMFLGVVLGRLLRVPSRISWLISTGTAICGGSAIAAVGPILEADQNEMSVSLGTVFLLNGLALLAFPLIGSACGLSPEQFGLWAALSIHDTSSVVGATARYGGGALAVGTTVKLARALWILPVSLGVAALRASKAKVRWPWFVLLFAAASALSTALPQVRPLYAWLNSAARTGLTLTLFLIGSQISRSTLKQVGHRPFLHGVLLWLVVACGSLALVAGGWIR